MCLDYLNGVARKSIMEGEIKSSQSWPNKWRRESLQLWKAAPSSFPPSLGSRVGFGDSRVGFGDSRASPQRPQGFQSMQTLWRRSEMNPWWFSSSLVEMAHGRGRIHIPRRGRTAPRASSSCSAPGGLARCKKKKKKGNRGKPRHSPTHPPPRAEPFADGPGPGMQKQKGCKCWLCISVSCHLCKRRPHARWEGRRILKRSHHQQHCSCQESWAGLLPGGMFLVAQLLAGSPLAVWSSSLAAGHGTRCPAGHLCLRPGCVRWRRWRWSHHGGSEPT